MKDLDQLIKLIPRQFAIRIGAAQHGIKRILVPRFSSAGSDDLLHEYVEWLRRNLELVQITGSHRLHQGCAFDQVITGCGEKAALWNCASPMPCATNPLHSCRNRAGRPHLANQIDGANIDAQFQRRCRDQQFDFAIPRSRLRVQAKLARKTAVMRGDIFRVDAFSNCMREPLDHARVFTNTRVARCSCASAARRS